MPAESSAANLLLASCGAYAAPHGVTTRGWHNGPGSWWNVLLWITWGLPQVPEC